MEKNRIRPVKVGNGLRMSYAHQNEVLDMPNLIEVQTDSYQWFLDEGLKEVFRDISPISDFGGHLSLEFEILSFAGMKLNMISTSAKKGMQHMLPL